MVWRAVQQNHWVNRYLFMSLSNCSVRSYLACRCTAEYSARGCILHIPFFLPDAYFHTLSGNNRPWIDCDFIFLSLLPAMCIGTNERSYFYLSKAENICQWRYGWLKLRLNSNPFLAVRDYSWVAENRLQFLSSWWSQWIPTASFHTWDL